MGSNKLLGKNIKKARLDAELTQAQVADKAGIHVNYFARIERGIQTPSVDVLEAIANAVKVKAAELLS